MPAQTHDNILITGGAGMLAQALARSLRARKQNPIILDRAALDIADPDSLERALETHRPALVLNAAAYTKVDLAEIETQAAERTNAIGPEILSRACVRRRARLVHFSTDFVFDGASTRPYRPTDPTNPVSAYGRTKRDGERKVGPADLLIRTAWLYGPGGPNFVQTMLNAARAGKSLSVVNDQTGSPTFTHDLAEATLDLIDAGARGIYHVTNSGQTTWFDFAKAIFQEFDLNPELSPTTSAAWKRSRPNSAARPAYSVLDCSDYERLTAKKLPHWGDALHRYRLAIEGAHA